MSKFIDITGQRFGLWTAISYAARVKKKQLWRCRCDCGTERAVNGAELRNGKSTNCGCVRRANVASRNKTHGLSYTPEYVLWSGMIARCENPNHKGYRRYGGRGIRVCARWRHSFEDFLTDMGNRPAPELTVERIDNDGNYESGNCRWATHKEQGANMSRNRILEHDGISMTLQQWADLLGMDTHTLAYRIDRYGWSVAKAITTPVLQRAFARRRAVSSSLLPTIPQID